MRGVAHIAQPWRPNRTTHATPVNGGAQPGSRTIKKRSKAGRSARWSVLDARTRRGHQDRFVPRDHSME
ncbi:hypothetical protein AAV94_00740 [Lampropedia cohaerens]|uniref:Uncharacterized protein n=1 Tax=Lampropedia cohaerens TaxID=1610491 RepID=A0A0U1Q3F9_9BURK|nr:hypothetical protein AAV94_00740 [Lampropedia cohaerens]